MYQRLKTEKAIAGNRLKRSIVLFLYLFVIAAMLFPIGFTDGGSVISTKAASNRLNKSEKTMWVGDTLKLKVMHNKKKVKWSSSKKSVATVSAKGKVKAKKAGNAVITAKVGGKKYKCSVYVKKMSINKSGITLYVGDNKDLYLKNPKKDVTWFSSKPSVAYANGEKVFGVAAGRAVVVAQCDGKTYICNVEVLAKESAADERETNTKTEEKEAVTALSADKLTMPFDSTMSLTLNNPKGTVTWTTSDYSVAQVNGNKVYSTFVGEAVITAQCNGVSYSCTVTVVPGETEQMEREGIYTSKDKVALYIHTYHKLPSNFITKSYATVLGGLLERPLLRAHYRKCIGGDRYFNYEGSLPEKENRKYYECDINTLGAQSRGTERLVYSNDGLIYYTPDHYNTFILLYEE